MIGFKSNSLCNYPHTEIEVLWGSVLSIGSGRQCFAVSAVEAKKREIQSAAMSLKLSSLISIILL